ncbi:acyl-CoA dehydrogenase family protein [Mycolicibacterium phlei]|uniref:acyl-CoA dehydrogenase family protein n=1 Tax=Mycolicibacterium phlei TaxID=1771 RepID=UPI0037CB2150
MLLEFDADQRLWQETVRDAVTKQCPASLIRDIAENGVDPTPLWTTYVDAGWTELADPENAVELAIVLEELGRATDPTPFLSTLSQFAPLVGDRFDPQKAGSAVYSGISARRDADGWLLSGTARYVVDGDRAERFAVVTEAGVFLVDADQVTARRLAVFDPVLHIADVSFVDVHLPDTARLPVDRERARHVALTGLAVHTVGACQRILDLVLEHAKQRQQFGVAIGSFQAVQHKAVDMHVAIERARALAYFAALTIAEDDPRRRMAAAMAKASAGEAQAVVFRHGVQLFGAMGFTWENDLQFALKRAKAGELLLGGAAEHRAVVVEEHQRLQRRPSAAQV